MRTLTLLFFVVGTSVLAAESTAVLQDSYGAREGFEVVRRGDAYQIRRVFEGQPFGFARLPQQERERVDTLVTALERLPAASPNVHCGLRREVRRDDALKIVCLDGERKLQRALSRLELDLVVLLAQ